MNKFFSKILPSQILFVFIFAMAIGLLFLRITLGLSYLPETGGVSINVMYGIIRLASGSSLYTNPELPPFSIVQYMPLHYFLVEKTGLLLGVSNNIHSMMVLNRMLCLTFDILSVLIIAYALLKIISVKRTIAWSLSLVYFLSIPSVIYGRVDSLYLMLFILTCIILIKLISGTDISKRRSFALLLLAGIVCSLTIVTKQTGVFFLVFCSVYFIFIKKSFTSIIQFYIGMVIACSALVLILFPDSIQVIKLNVVDGVKNGVSISWFFEVILKNYFLKYSFVLVIGFLTAILLLRYRSNDLFLFIAFGIVFYFSIAIITSLKAGSGSNYFLEFIVLSIFGFAILIKHHPNLFNSTIELLALCFMPFFMLAAINDKGIGDLKLLKSAKYDYNNCTLLANYLLPKLKSNEWVLTNFHRESTINLQLSDKALFPCREVAVNYSLPLKVFHFSKFAHLVKQAEVPYLVVKKNDQLLEFINIPLENYKIDTTLGNYSIYKKQNRFLE